MSEQLVAALEAGGTKMVAALATRPLGILIREQIPTTSPGETMARLVAFFRSAAEKCGQPEALAVGTFGPADLDPESPSYGTITATPKPGWSGADLLGPLRRALGDLPVVFETDVNAALMGEVKWGAARGLKNAAYLTVGTGIGGGLMIDGSLVHGAGHSEMGHMRVMRHPNDDFEGTCSFHQDCLEGLASGTALAKRWGQKPEELPVDHPAWEMEAHYLAQACVNVLAIAPPERIILGGGVMHQEQLLPLIRAEIAELSRGYFGVDDLARFVVTPELGDDAGLLGCVALGQQILASGGFPR